MDTLQDFGLDKDILVRLEAFEEEVQNFRNEGPLDPIATKKLQEYFRVQHIYHSTGIEGNRLSIRETEMVLLEGLQINDKPLADQQEVKDLDAAFNFLHELAEGSSPIREIDIREMHRLVVRNRIDAQPGKYRTIGVVITGSDHKPPEPIAVPSLVQRTIEWLNTTAGPVPISVEKGMAYSPESH
jgi:Fic family protein